MASEPKNVAERPKAVHTHEAHPTISCGKAGRLPDPPVSKGYFTLPNGCPVEHPLLAERADKQIESTRYGSQLIQDLNTVEQIAHISRERIPERCVTSAFQVTVTDLNVLISRDDMESRGRNYWMKEMQEGTGIELAEPADMSRDPSSDPNIATGMIGYDDNHTQHNRGT
ncbi:uncharacterized protein ACHE_11934A [Aspergillus chevalieri]|uniref:Catalase core domain-containing protein n=1 Tax=Aspergillus chevalieri TaxID=182096 RepID=A0A7R7VHN1_ASPCH|nr:uncharacterized protein ACHE_11934A [Aspergillus chevalieri]BCR84532.1 hypothetical protein ACHE_11934A [Aspergillus chevalieri]